MGHVHAQARELLAVAGADLRRQHDRVLLGRGLGAKAFDPFVDAGGAIPSEIPASSPASRPCAIAPSSERAPATAPAA